jgi:uncharacterized membrane protein YgdD (TMEM256/DUF423 family)
MKKLAVLIFGVALSVILGALGAHFLKKHLTAEQLDSFKTGVHYQSMVCILLLIFTLMQSKFQLPKKPFLRVWHLVFWGMVLFSGSIYVLSTQSLWISSSLKWLGPVTPVGGVMMIAGLLYWGVLTARAKH